jgi:hypothetical protein
MSETSPATPAPESTPQQPASATAAELAPLVTSVPIVAPHPVVDAEPQDDTEITVTKAEPAASPAIQTSSPVVQSVAKQDEGPEPQSSLTKKFTEAEWSALKDFRV